MKSKAQSGFTLIELVMVIVILGILAATALPKFIDLKTDAQTAATKGVAGALGAAHAINYASRTAVSTKGVAVTDCSSTGLGTFDAAYTITAAAIAAGATATCTVTGPNSSTATFTGYGIS